MCVCVGMTENDNNKRRPEQTGEKKCDYTENDSINRLNSEWEVQGGEETEKDGN